MNSNKANSLSRHPARIFLVRNVATVLENKTVEPLRARITQRGIVAFKIPLPCREGLGEGLNPVLASAPPLAPPRNVASKANSVACQTVATLRGGGLIRQNLRTLQNLGSSVTQKANRFQTRRLAARRGSMLLEVIVSAALLAVLLTIINQVVVQLHRQTRLVDRHLLAQQTLENLLEDAVGFPWSSLTSDRLAKLELPELTREKLPDAMLSAEVSEEEDPVLAKRVTLRLSWRSASGKPRPPLVLTTWVYKQMEAQP